ncbi:MAG: LptF/LptG family permease [Flavobacteriales bacterium]
MITILDRYIIRKFLGTFFFMIIAFVVIAVVFDVSENIDDLVMTTAPWYKIITHYYLNFAFHFANLLSSFIVFLTIIWITSKLAQRSEIVAMLSGGISYNRILRPYFISAFILVCLSLFLNHYVVPRTNRTKYDFEVQYLKGAHTVQDQNIHREIEPGTIAYFYKFNPGTMSGSNFSLEKWDRGRLTWKLLSSGATFVPETGRWSISQATIREFHPDGSETLIRKAQFDTILNLDVEDFGLRSEIVSSMGWSELNAFIEDQRLSGSGRVAQFEIEKYNRTAGPFAIFILTIIAVSIASRKSRGGTGLHLLVAVVIGFVFVFVSRLTAVSAMNLGFAAWIAVWVPNVIFLLVGLWLFSRAQK